MISAASGRSHGLQESMLCTMLSCKHKSELLESTKTEQPVLAGQQSEGISRAAESQITPPD